MLCFSSHRNSIFLMHHDFLLGANIEHKNKIVRLFDMNIFSSLSTLFGRTYDPTWDGIM